MLDDEMHYLLLVAYNQSSRGINERAAGLGLTPGQPKVLEYLLEHDGAQAREVCQAFCIDKSTIALLLSRMERAGLVRRTVDQADRRIHHIWLTDEGRTAAQAMKREILDFDAGFWADIDPEDLAATKRVLARVARQDTCKRKD